MKTSPGNFCMFCICILFCKSTVAQNANTSLSNLVAPVKINVVLQPDKDNKHSLGSTTKAWKNLYIDSAVYVAGSKFLSAPGLWSTATGFSALASNVSGFNNTANGFLALYHNTSGYLNSAFGSFALSYNTTGSNNSAFGTNSLYLNTGDYNSAFGTNALTYNSTGSNNTASGTQALYSNTTGGSNTAQGFGALYANTIGSENIALGSQALNYNTTASLNVAVGNGALYYQSFSNNNTVYNTFNVGIGYQALYNNQPTLYYNGDNNTAVGAQALLQNTNGQNNTAVGYTTLYSNHGIYNTGLGAGAGFFQNSGSYNTFLGTDADISFFSSEVNNSSAIGYDAVVYDDNEMRIGNGSVNSIGGPVDWTSFSDERIKKDIKENVPGLSFINLLKPVTYHFNLAKESELLGIKNDTAEWKTKHDIEKINFTGLLAQQVDSAAKKINYDFSGVDRSKGVWGLRYAQFVVPLVKAVQELSKQNDSLKQAYSDLETKYENQQKEIDAIKSMISVSNTSPINSLQPTLISSASLQQNVPNPFANSTTINYSIPQKYSSAKIIVTDKNGVALKQLNLSARKGSVTINASTLSSGAYQYALYVDGRMIDTKQMISTK